MLREYKYIIIWSLKNLFRTVYLSTHFLLDIPQSLQCVSKRKFRTIATLARLGIVQKGAHPRELSFEGLRFRLSKSVIIGEIEVDNRSSVSWVWFAIISQFCSFELKIFREDILVWCCRCIADIFLFILSQGHFLFLSYLQFLDVSLLKEVKLILKCCLFLDHLLNVSAASLVYCLNFILKGH